MITDEKLKEIQSTEGFENYQRFPDKLNILVCQIQVWNLQDPTKPTEGPTNGSSDGCITLNEVENIEISESFKKLIGTATVKFPRGTVVKKTITSENVLKEDKKIAVIANVSQQIGDVGVVEELLGEDKRLATTADFASGKRIRIKLGYVTSPDMVKYVNDEEKNKSFLFTMFDGYITKCSVSTPIELKCENLANGLKKISCINHNSEQDETVNDFLKEGSTYDLLKNSGLKLHPCTEVCNINIGKVPLSSDLTVADVLTEWSKYKLFAFIKDYNGEPRIAVGRSYFASSSKESILNGAPNITPVIQFDYHVAKDDLTLMNTEKRWLAVEAQMADINGKFYKITIRLNPDYDPTAKEGEQSKKFDLLNETALSRKAQKLGAIKKSGTSTKVDLSSYTLIQYMSRKIVDKISNDEKEQLIKEAIAYFEGYEMTGIDGHLTIFGDLHLHTGMKVELLDIRQSGKNGYYLVEEVNTSFGVRGYRQTIKLPYRLTKKDMKDSVESNVNK